MAVTIKTLVNHPFSFAVGIGVANGLLAVARGKKIDIPTALWLSAILGLGEMALEMYVPAEERAHSLPAIGAHSVAGVLLGVLPFVTTEPGHHGGGLPIASRTEPGGGATAVSGWARNARRVAARRRL